MMTAKALSGSSKLADIAAWVLPVMKTWAWLLISPGVAGVRFVTGGTW
jgi:hypothetical protein